MCVWFVSGSDTQLPHELRASPGSRTGLITFGRANLESAASGAAPPAPRGRPAADLGPDAVTAHGGGRCPGIRARRRPRCRDNAGETHALPDSNCR